MKKIWSLEDLPELKAGDNLAFKAEGIWTPLMKFIGAMSFHWAKVGDKTIDDEVSIGDYEVADSTDKGITAHLLSEYQYRHMRVYRPNYLERDFGQLKPYILKRYLYYGDQHYDYKGIFMVALWLLLRKIGLKIDWWEHNSNQFWCIEFDNIVDSDFGYPDVPDNEPPYPTNMERSTAQQLIWGTF